ncbi:MAG: flagellar basal-body rod protein FlgF [Candidatus Kapaibacteriales bacterium]
MLKELYTAAYGMLNQESRLEVTANNISNANTTGFKRQNVFERNLIDARANFYNVKGDAEQNDSPVGSYTDFSQGQMTQTTNPLDLALENDGFFVLSDEFGKQFLSRGGNFRLDQAGNIVTMDGKMLLGTNGPLNTNAAFFGASSEPEDKQNLDLRVTLQGEVFANGFNIGNIQVAQVNETKTLERISAQNFIHTEDTEISYLQPQQIAVRQGWLEKANVDVVSEMVEMIGLQRKFEAGAKVIETNESTLSNSIQLGRYY